MLNKILRDIKVELLDEFDRNFQRGAFFSKPWPKKRDGTATHLNNTGKLRRSITARISGHCVIFTSSEPYAAIHNYGGIVYVRPHHRTVQKKVNGELKKVRKQMKGYNYKMPRRQFVGDSPEVKKAVEDIVHAAMEAELHKVATQKP